MTANTAHWWTEQSFGYALWWNVAEHMVGESRNCLISEWRKLTSSSAQFGLNREQPKMRMAAKCS